MPHHHSDQSGPLHFRLSRRQQFRLWLGLQRRRLWLAGCGTIATISVIWLQQPQPLWWLFSQLCLGLLLVLLVVALCD